MSIFSTLPPSEQARQLAFPEGATGLGVAEWLNENNRESNARALAALQLEDGNNVLEIGFGNGRAAFPIVNQAANVRYEGIDISSTMVDEANRFNAALVVDGRARFNLASAERMPFADASFDRVLSIGVIHFWKEPLACLREVRRVMRPTGLIVMRTLDSRSPPQFAQPEFGFYLRSAEEWSTLCRQAGFNEIDARTLEVVQVTPDGKPTKRYAVQVVARG